MKVITETRHAH